MFKLKVKQLSLVIGDFIFMLGALFLALTLRYLDVPEALEAHFWTFLPIFLGLLIAYYIAGYYDLKTLPYGNSFIQGLMKINVFLLAVAVGYFYVFPNQSLSPKTNLVLFIVIYSIIFVFWRRIFFSMLRGSLYKTNIAFIGYNKRIAEIIEDIKHNPQLGYKTKIILTEAKIDIPGVHIIKSNEGLEELVAKYNIGVIVMEKGTGDDEELKKRLFNCLPLGVSYISLSNFYERITGKIALEIIGQAWFLENLNLADKKIYESTKRVIDLILALFIFTVTLPIWPILAIIIKIESKGPVMFTQMRLGKNNIPFQILKFRTMKVEGNDYKLTEKDDNRITKWGNFMRKTRLDEIPQVLNIIRGEMSFVGPRPERPELAGGLENKVPFFGVRTLVKPGISGWDQISGEYHSPTAEDTYKKLQYDLFYLKNRSIYLDLTVILKTAKAVLVKGGR